MPSPSRPSTRPYQAEVVQSPLARPPEPLRKAPPHEVLKTVKHGNIELTELWFKGPASPTSTAGYTKVFAYYERPYGPADGERGIGLTAPGAP